MKHLSSFSLVYILLFVFAIPTAPALADDIGITGYDPAGNAVQAFSSPATTRPPSASIESSTFDYKSPWMRGLDDWEFLVTESISVSVPEAGHLGVCFDPASEELSFIDPTEESSPTQVAALERAPAWLREDLRDNFRRFEFSVIADWAAQEILNAPDPYVDEVAFQVAHIAPGLLNGVINFELLLENAAWVYAVDSTLQYVQLVDYGNSNDDDYWTTAQYRIVEENGDTVEVEIDRDKYYWFVVHPKLSDELPTYIDPSTGDPAAPPTGVFWRSWFWTYADSGFSLYSEIWDSCEFYWDKTNTSTDAIDIMNQWIDNVMDFGAGAERPVQPVRIYVLHCGNCGEYQDMRGAAGRTALIPTANASNLCEDHVWNEIWEREWIHWDGTLNNPLMYENSWGKTLSSVFNWRGDGYVWTVTERYSADLCTLNVTIYDSVGKPADGARIKVYSEAWQSSQQYYATWGITNSYGEVSFVLGDDQNFYLRVDGPLGSYPANPDQTVSVITASVPGQAYYWEYTLDDCTPDLEISPAQVYPNPLDDYKMEIEYQVEYESVYGTYFTNFGFPNDFAEKMNTGCADFFILNGANYAAYQALEPAEGFAIAPKTTSGAVAFVLPTDEPWYGLFSNRELSINRPMVDAIVNIYRSSTPVIGESTADELPREYALNTPYPNPFNSETEIAFDLPVSGRTTISVHNLLGQEVASLTDDKYTPGKYTISWNGLNNHGQTIASGIYLVQMKSGSADLTKKVCFLR